MAEVYRGDDVLIKEVTGTVESRIDIYCKDVTISSKKDYVAIRNEAGVPIKRILVGQDAEMSISQMFATEVSFTDGNNIKVYFADNLGTATYQMGSCYITEKGWKIPEDDGVVHDVKIIGGSFGTTT